MYGMALLNFISRIQVLRYYILSAYNYKNTNYAEKKIPLNVIAEQVILLFGAELKNTTKQMCIPRKMLFLHL